MKGHKSQCEYRKCDCIACKAVDERNRVMAIDTKKRRALNISHYTIDENGEITPAQADSTENVNAETFKIEKVELNAKENADFETGNQCGYNDNNREPPPPEFENEVI